MSPFALVWFRRDLRLDDNPALQAALAAGQLPVPVYIHAPDEEAPWQPGAASRAWLARSLAALAGDLQQRGSGLVVMAGDSLACLQQLATACGAVAVYWNRQYEPARARHDTTIKAALRGRGLHAASHNGRLLAEPWQLLSGQGTPYKVFTPYWKALAPQLRLPPPAPAPARLPALPAAASALAQPLDSLALAPHPAWDRGFWEHFVPGEAGAREALQVFIEGALDGYQTQRDLPDRVGTSQLSPHLHFGEIAPWAVVHALQAATTAANQADVQAWIRQLAWRDFAHYTLHHSPRSAGQDLNPRFARMAWRQPQAELLASWQRGRTGVPIVDAGMRELWHTGWMHNRVRMIAGSWLCKHMRLHWRHGAAWFWDTLVDADLANNSLGWQWIAGTGVDAAPYFRIFNPVTQSQKFDPQARYLTHWLPELAALPVPARHAPWLHGGVRGYPAAPNVDLAKGREEALAAYRASAAGS